MANLRNPHIDGIRAIWYKLTHGLKFNRGATWGMMIIGALLSFEVFNFSTTQFALHDMLGDLTFAGMRWSTVLAIAFCGIDAFSPPNYAATSRLKFIISLALGFWRLVSTPHSPGGAFL